MTNKTEVVQYQPLAFLGGVLQRLFAKGWNLAFFDRIPTTSYSTKKTREDLKAFREMILQKDSHKRISFNASDGITLDGVLLNEGKEKVILFVPGIGSFYEQIGSKKSVMRGFVDFFSDHFPHCSCLVFNNRGIGESEGVFDFKRLKFDTVGAIDYLTQKQSYKMEDICLYTHSLGGLHAIQGAALVQERFPHARMTIVNDRSLGEISTFTKAFLKHSFFGQVGKALLEKIGLNVCNKEDWFSLKGKKLIIVSKQDRTIPYEGGSFYKMVEEKLSSEQILHLEEEEEIGEHHTRIYTPQEREQILAFLSHFHS
jgi:hypothetical protein